MSQKRKKHSFTLAESFSKEKSGGQKVDYPNPIAIKEMAGGAITMAICFIAY